MPSHRSCKSWRGAAATRRLVTGLVALVVGAGAQAAEQCSARSGPAVVPVVELYTAEGCSSCPPADQWLSHLQADPSIIALAFHVDYWDRDGWKDGFAKHAFTERQTVLQKSDGARFIYTPQVLVDGLDRPEWSVSAAPAMESRAAPVTIELSRHGSHVDATVSAGDACATASAGCLLGGDRERHRQRDQGRREPWRDAAPRLPGPRLQADPQLDSDGGWHADLLARCRRTDRRRPPPRRELRGRRRGHRQAGAGPQARLLTTGTCPRVTLRWLDRTTRRRSAEKWLPRETARQESHRPSAMTHAASRSQVGSATSIKFPLGVCRC